MPDLVSGRYQLQNGAWSALGQVNNVTQGDVPFRSNIEWHGIASMVETVLVTKKTQVAAVPVSYGDVITKLSFQCATQEGESGEVWGAVYAGANIGKTSKLLAQSKSKTEVVPKEALFTVELEKSILITPENAPSGYIFAGINETAGTTPAKIAAYAVKPKIVPLTTTAPAYGGQIAQKSGTEAAAEWTVAANEFTPVVILT